MLVLAFGGCAHLAATEARTAQDEAAARNTASFEAALAEAVKEAGATLLPEPSGWFQPDGDCSRSRRAAPDLPPLPVVLQHVTADCDALLAALRSGDSLETTDGSGAEVSLLLSPLDGASLGRTQDGVFVLFTPQPQVTLRRMTVVTPGLSCCCGSSGDEAHRPRRFWVLPGHGLALRSVAVPFELERVELRCDPRAPQ